MKIIVIVLCSFLSSSVFSQSMEAFEPSQQWINKIREIAPSETQFEQDSPKRVLVFSKHTGFNHWVIPHSELMMEVIMEKVGGYEVHTSKDIMNFEKKQLKKYDVIILNNNCSIGDKRDLFWDVLKTEMDSSAATKKAAKLEKNLLKFVKKGGGVFTLHGGIVMQNKSEAFSKMLGGSFHYHPKQQEIHVQAFDKSHPLTSAFKSGSFTHFDEPYVFNGDYSNKNFRPLLYYNASEIEGLRNPDGDAKRYNSWIKRYGKGRVFYSSPSHNAQSFSNPELLQFFLNGLQYVAGDVDVDDSPIGQ